MERSKILKEAINLDPMSGPGHIQLAFPVMTHQEATAAFYRMHNIRLKSQHVPAEDQDLYNTYIQWYTYNELING
jgi:hypothetical protein